MAYKNIIPSKRRRPKHLPVRLWRIKGLTARQALVKERQRKVTNRMWAKVFFNPNSNGMINVDYGSCIYYNRKLEIPSSLKK